MAKASEYAPTRSRAPIVHPEKGTPEPAFQQFLNDAQRIFQQVADQQEEIAALQATVQDLQDQIDAKCP